MQVHNEKNNATVRINDPSPAKASVRDRIEAFKDNVFNHKAVIRGAQPAILAPEQAKKLEFPNLGNHNPLGPLRPILNELGAMQSKPRIFPINDGNRVLTKVIEDHIGRYEFAREYTEGKRVLDVACGSGYGTAILLNNALSRIGLDIETEAIDYARSNYYKWDVDANKGLKFTCADAMDFLNSPLFFGTIVSLETITYMEDPMKFLGLVYKSLEPGGTLVLSTPNRIFTDLFYGGIFNSAHKHEFYTYEMASMIESVFGEKSQIFALRPVKKESLVRSGIRAFLENNPQIVPLTDEITGINNIFVARKKSSE